MVFRMCWNYKIPNLEVQGKNTAYVLFSLKILKSKKEEKEGRVKGRGKEAQLELSK